MTSRILKWLRIHYKNIGNSIAFLPVLIALLFVFIVWLMILFDASVSGKNIKSQTPWLSLKDAATARSIISAIVTGIISLTVFSFSMVMIVLNQAASQLSNRILYKLIGNRSQQMVLGFYIGTIVYSLFLLSTIKNVNSEIEIPALSTYLLIAFTIIDIFLFIYFLHYITKSVRFETIIKRIHLQTKNTIKNSDMQDGEADHYKHVEGITIKAGVSGIFQGFDKEKLLKFCVKQDIAVSFIYPAGTFILKSLPFLIICNTNNISPEGEDKIHSLTDISNSEIIESNFYYGFRQLKEVAVKALSPGINDPGTAILSLYAIVDLLTFRLQHPPVTIIRDSKGTNRIYVREKTFEEMFTEYLLPIWDYGRIDRSIQQEFKLVLTQLQTFTQHSLIDILLQNVELAIKEKDLKV